MSKPCTAQQNRREDQGSDSPPGGGVLGRRSRRPLYVSGQWRPLPAWLGCARACVRLRALLLTDVLAVAATLLSRGACVCMRLPWDFITAPQAEIEEISKQVSMMFSGAAGATGATGAAGAAGPAGINMKQGARKDFRQRRLTFAMQRDRSTSADMEHTTTVYCSAEIGEVRDVTPPFPSNILGTYSCHGIEPSWTDEGYTEKINQDRGCVVHPFRQSLREALFCVFDGAWPRPLSFELADPISCLALSSLRGKPYGPQATASTAISCRSTS